ncbi:flagellar filament capping protein FliD [Candidatus Ventrimonas sp. KK005]
MGVNGVSSSYGYGYGYGSYQNSGINSSSWYDKASADAEKLKEDLDSKTNSSSSSSSSSSTTTTKATSSTSAFLIEYQTRLEDLEASAAKLQTSKKDNVFSKYEAALAEASKTQIVGDDGTITNKELDDAANAVVDATKDFINQLNGTISYLSKNVGHSATVAFQLAGLKRTIPSDKALAKIGISVDTKGNLKMDEDKFREALEKDPNLVKDLLGGQFGMAERAGDKATSILDMSVDDIMDTQTSSSDTSNSSSSSSSSSASASASASKSMMSDSFRQFALFAKSSPYNLSNYYAVSMLNLLV